MVTHFPTFTNIIVFLWKVGNGERKVSIGVEVQSKHRSHLKALSSHFSTSVLISKGMSHCLHVAFLGSLFFGVNFVSFFILILLSASCMCPLMTQKYRGELTFQSQLLHLTGYSWESYSASHNLIVLLKEIWTEKIHTNFRTMAASIGLRGQIQSRLQLCLYHFHS